MKIATGELDYQVLNEIIRSSTDKEVELDGCCGQRYIGAGLSGRTITIHGTPGNALGAYLNGCDVVVDGNAQDAIGDTMNAGRIVINGNAGDAVGYAMRGGKIFVRGDAGYRVGIHMKAYKEHRPVIVVGGIVGSFLGEYQAGGIIVVLGDGAEGSPVGNFCGAVRWASWATSAERECTAAKCICAARACPPSFPHRSRRSAWRRSLPRSGSSSRSLRRNSG